MQRHVRDVVSAMILAVAVAAGMLALVMVVIGERIVLPMAIGALCVSGIAAFALRRGHVQLAGALMPIGLLAVSVYAAVRGFGIHDTALAMFPAVVMIGSLFFARGLAWTLVSLTIVTVVLLALAEVFGLFTPPAVHTVDIGDVLVVPTVLLVMAVVTRQLIGKLVRSLMEASASERNYREILDATNEAIFIHDAEDGSIVDLNLRTVEMYGYTRAEVMGLSLGQLGADQPEHSTANALQMIHRAARGPQVFEWLAKKKDGTEFWVEVSLQASSIGGNGRVLAVVRDISERKAIEDKLRQAETMEAVGKLAGGIAHDFNNQLTGILGFAKVLRVDQMEAVDRELVDGIVTMARRAADLTGQLLAFARKGRTATIEVDLHSIIDEVVGLLKRSVDKRIRLAAEYDGGSATVVGDPTQLQNVFLNLALNARDAMPHGGALRFSTSWVEVSHTHQATDPAHTGLMPGRYVAVAVTDTGEGMEEETLARIYEPFFTTKPRGTGMGLSAVYGTVEAHGGSIAAESMPGVGTVFTVMLPWCEPSDSPTPPPPSTKLELNGLRVVLVDDEPNVRRSVARMLERVGCVVKVCTSAQEIIEFYEQHWRALDLVVVDMMMPDMMGHEVIARLHETNPDLRALAISGCAEPALDGLNAVQAVVTFITKPFDPDQLQEAVEIAIGARSPRTGSGPLRADGENNDTVTH